MNKRAAIIAFEQRKKVAAILHEVVMLARLKFGFYGDGGIAERAREAKHSPFLITVKKRKEVRYETFQARDMSSPVKIPSFLMISNDVQDWPTNRIDDIVKTAENTRYEEE